MKYLIYPLLLHFLLPALLGAQDSAVIYMNSDFEASNFKVSAQDSLSTQIDTSECNLPFLVFVDEQAKFQGCDIENFREWLHSNITYLTDNNDIGNFRRITFQFIVNDIGKVVCVKILRPADNRIEQEILQLMNHCPDWIPAWHGGKNVNQMFVVAILN